MTDKGFQFCNYCKKHVDKLCVNSQTEVKHTYQGVPIITCENMPQNKMACAELKEKDPEVTGVCLDIAEVIAQAKLNRWARQRQEEYCRQLNSELEGKPVPYLLTFLDKGLEK